MISDFSAIPPLWAVAAGLKVSVGVGVAATLEYRPAPRWGVFGGYRTIEGGADVDTVYAFAWLNAVVSGIGVRF